MLTKRNLPRVNKPCAGIGIRKINGNLLGIYKSLSRGMYVHIHFSGINAVVEGSIGLAKKSVMFFP